MHCEIKEAFPVKTISTTTNCICKSADMLSAPDWRVSEIVAVNNKYGLYLRGFGNNTKGCLVFGIQKYTAWIQNLFSMPAMALKVPKCEIFHLFNLNDFYGIKSL